MCSIFGPIMDNYQGDLADIIRASGASYGSCSTGTSSSGAAPSSHDHWLFSSDTMNFSSILEDPRVSFGDPFSNTRDPFLLELDMPPSAYFNSASSAEINNSGGLEETACFGGGVIGSSDTFALAQEILEDDMRRPRNSIFSKMIQISPNAKLPISPSDSPVMAVSPRVSNASAVVSGNMNTSTAKDNCLVENTGVQISSPRNPGLKRSRKSQAKKSICIPAPAALNSRQSGEVVPSDLWAWRKYGQKPIKGSPYPRGYYRCSSSKGCPARKQVERSRTDPNMLVITYTSEHNHPWPIQRNALAGSTRSQPSKNNAASKNSETIQPQKGTTKPKEEQQESNSDSNASPVVNSSNIASVKEEIDGARELSSGLPSKPSKLKCHQLENFLAELGEIEADSLSLLSGPGFSEVDDQNRESKAFDPFHISDWSQDYSTEYHLI